MLVQECLRTWTVEQSASLLLEYFVEHFVHTPGRDCIGIKEAQKEIVHGDQYSSGRSCGIDEPTLPRGNLASSTFAEADRIPGRVGTRQHGRARRGGEADLARFIEPADW